MIYTLILANLAGVPPDTLATLNSANSFLTFSKPYSNSDKFYFLNLKTLNFLSIFLYNILYNSIIMKFTKLLIYTNIMCNNIF